MTDQLVNTQADPSRDYWTPAALLDGKTVFLLGGGPSLTRTDVERLRGRQVIAINTACRLAPWAPFLFFTDSCWFDAHRHEVETWPGVVITASRQAKQALPAKLHRINLLTQPEFSVGDPVLKFGRTSGHTAISLAIAMGAVRVVLLGYDMRRVDGRSHFHDEYGSQDDKLFSHDFLIHFAGWNEAARRCGVAVINVTPGSALTEFPTGVLDDILAERADGPGQHPDGDHAGALAGSG